MPTQPPSLLVHTAPHLGQLLKAARKRHRMSQAAVAARVAISQNRLSVLENNPGAISVAQLLSWCAALGLELRMGERPGEDQTNASEW